MSVKREKALSHMHERILNTHGLQAFLPCGSSTFISGKLSSGSRHLSHTPHKCIINPSIRARSHNLNV